MIEPGLVTVIVPVHNRPGMLREAVASVLAQTYRPIETILVDDGSTDETPSVCEELATSYPGAIRVLRVPNGGPGQAREAGRREARGEFIQYLDSDDLLWPRKLEVQVVALRGRPDCGVAYGYTRHCRVGRPPDQIPWKGSGQTVEAMFPSFLLGRWWDTPTPLYRRSVCDAAGPWAALRCEEDWEYDCRVAALGTRLVQCREFVADVRDHEGPRLCRVPADDVRRLQDRAAAHLLILGHALKAGLRPGDPEMTDFSRQLFFLGRQCAAANLGGEAGRLLKGSRIAAGREGRDGWDVSAFEMGARFLGWRRAGRLAAAFDAARAARRGT